MARSVIFHVRKELQPFVTLCHHAPLVQKNLSHSFLRRVPKATREFFSLRLPQFSCQCNFATFFASPRFFLHFGKFNADTRNDTLVYARHNQFTMQFWRMIN